MLPDTSTFALLCAVDGDVVGPLAGASLQPLVPCSFFFWRAFFHTLVSCHSANLRVTCSAVCSYYRRSPRYHYRCDHLVFHCPLPEPCGTGMRKVVSPFQRRRRG